MSETSVKPLKALPGRKASTWPSSQEWDRAYERWDKIRSMLRARNPDVEFELQMSSSQHSGSVQLSRCRSKAIGSGAGSAFLRDLAFYADTEGVSLKLLIGSHPDNPTSPEQLRRWYGEFGFLSSGELHMTRQPNAPVSRAFPRDGAESPGESSDLAPRRRIKP